STAGVGPGFRRDDDYNGFGGPKLFEPRTVLDRKGIAAAAGGGGVRVLDLEGGAHQILDEIDLGPVQQVERHVVDDDRDPAMFEHDVVWAGLLVKAQP